MEAGSRRQAGKQTDRQTDVLRWPVIIKNNFHLKMLFLSTRVWMAEASRLITNSKQTKYLDSH
jgi:hypothetical protein